MKNKSLWVGHLKSRVRDFNLKSICFTAKFMVLANFMVFMVQEHIGNLSLLGFYDKFYATGTPEGASGSEQTNRRNGAVHPNVHGVGVKNLRLKFASVAA